MTRRRRIEKSWGYEHILHNGTYCAKLLVYTKPIASSLHYHERKHETFIVASGQFEVFVERPSGHVTKGWLEPGAHLVLPPGTKHRIRCLIPGTIIEASSHDDPSDCVRIEPSEQ